MYFDLDDSQIKTPNGRCVRESRFCKDEGSELWRCSTGAMSCCSDVNCNAYNHTTLCAEDEYAKAYAQAFPPRLAINRVFAENASRIPQCLYSKGPLYLFGNESVTSMVPFLSGLVQRHGFDGLYMDQFYYAPTYGRTVYEALLNDSGEYDTDGDGKADTVESMTAQAAKWFPVFIERLRQELGPSALLLGNGNFGAGTDLPLSPAEVHVNGRTIEMEGCKNVTGCIHAFRAHAEIGHAPHMGVLWLTHSDIVPLETQCRTAAEVQAALPWVAIGTDYYDGSHVICNSGHLRPPPPPPPPPPPWTQGDAYYMLQEATLSSPSWPASFAHYSVFVAPATLSPSAIKTVHRDIPGGVVLAYTAMNVIDGRHQPGDCSNCSYIYADGSRCVLEEYMSPHWFCRELSSDRPICPHKQEGKVRPFVAWVPTEQSAEEMAAFHGNVTMARGFDGLYVDEAFAEWGPASWLARLEEAGNTTAGFDCSGDGERDSAASLQAQYAAYKPLYFARLRAHIGARALLLANTGVPVNPDPSLNGAAVESEWCSSRTDLPGAGWEGCTEALEGQGLVAHQPAMSVLWLSQSKSSKDPHGMPAEEQCAHAHALGQRLPWLRTGYDVSDGSWTGGQCKSYRRVGARES